jgi:signal transduction histidine kinase/CheY-like chemotaxis protein
MLYWLAGHTAVSLLRLALNGAYFRRRPPPSAAGRWGAASAALTFLSGCMWALACVLFFDPAQPLTVIAITAVLLALSGGSAAMQGTYLISFWAFISPALGALVAVPLWHGGLVNGMVAFIATIAACAYFLGARNIRHLHAEALRLGFENVALRREAEDKSRLLEATLRNMRQGISLSDAQGRLRTWNPQFVELVGLPDAAVGERRPLPEVLGHARPPLTLGAAQYAEYHRGDGGVIELAQNEMPDGGRVVTYADITDRKRREAALEAARRSAEYANAAKTRFLAAASHDLRQPIHVLGLLLATLADRVRDERSAPLLEQMGDAVEAVDSMLASLLDISKLDAGVEQPAIAPLDVGALLRRLGNEHLPIAELTGNRLTVRATGAFARSDASMLHRILANLVSNALRYTSNGRVLVGARRRGDSLRIDVVDTGPGIPPDSLEEIFLEFHQLGNPERDRRRGLGLGLAIVKRLAGLLGHAIEVRSVVGRGSRFSIAVPRTPEPQHARRWIEDEAPIGELQGRRVLVLDDEIAVREAMRQLLERWGCEVIMTGSPAEAEAWLDAEARLPDLLIVDYRLRQHASGIETIGRLRERAGTPIPALVITGDTAPDRLREAQVSGYPLLHKPVMPASLRAAMRRLMPAGEAVK